MAVGMGSKRQVDCLDEVGNIVDKIVGEGQTEKNSLNLQYITFYSTF